MNVLRESRSVTVSNIGRVPRIKVLNSENALIVEVESRLCEHRRMPAKQWRSISRLLFDLNCIGPLGLKSNVSVEVCI